MKKSLSLLVLFAVMNPVFATEVEDVLKLASTKISQATVSQKRVDALNNKQDALFSHFKHTNRSIENVRIYNAILRLQIQDQSKRLKQVLVSIRGAKSIGQEITPLTIRMISALENFIESDVPFSLKERQDRVKRLKLNISRSDLSEAEKVRQLLEAYKIEVDYGKNIESYTQILDLNGSPTEVDILRVGRIVLIYRTRDGDAVGVWDQTRKSWVEVDGYSSAVGKAIKVAKKKAPINILELPILAIGESS